MNRQHCKSQNLNQISPPSKAHLQDQMCACKLLFNSSHQRICPHNPCCTVSLASPNQLPNRQIQPIKHVLLTGHRIALNIHVQPDSAWKAVLRNHTDCAAAADQLEETASTKQEMPAAQMQRKLSKRRASVKSAKGRHRKHTQAYMPPAIQV